MDEIKKVKRTNYIALGVVIAVILGILGGFLRYRARRTFSTEKWIADRENRTRIVDDLLSQHPLEGMTRGEILDLLGEHDNDAGYFQQGSRFVYWLGPERGLFSIDSEWLILEFSGDVVTECYITTD